MEEVEEGERNAVDVDKGMVAEVEQHFEERKSWVLMACQPMENVGGLWWQGILVPGWGGHSAHCHLIGCLTTIQQTTS